MAAKQEMIHIVAKAVISVNKWITQVLSRLKNLLTNRTMIYCFSIISQKVFQTSSKKNAISFPFPFLSILPTKAILTRFQIQTE